MTAEELRKIRKGSGLSQWQLALKLGMSQGTITNWERGYREIPDDQAEKIKLLR
ncbi:helix-turn-helix transcriptional regulator [Oceanispirochaeta sp.]|jgi:DNA-binding transcriptional regulator YiaG|uniref:helix-turn-helix domain-containing protein n=1 Tax=Oceanispirochaeta sp. TaxID=2035350 RepID=UPI00263546AC|nr:helix-turn-helix transcriptional regulator [Oceanispirochaeta sp.]MDA3957330.1 helix-turn-helix transcriptional regulator [Oceanispirochaeta sp.]